MDRVIISPLQGSTGFHFRCYNNYIPSGLVQCDPKRNAFNKAD